MKIPKKYSNKLYQKVAVPMTVFGVGLLACRLKKLPAKLSKAFLCTSVCVATWTAVMPAQAQMSEGLVMAYAQSMQAAANGQNISQIARLVSDEAVIALTRQGKGSSTLDKSTYLDLLQKSWTQAKDYRYNIAVSDVVMVGEQAKALMVSTETWTKDGQAYKLTTTARVTLGSNGRNAVLLRSVAQVTLE